MGRSLETEADSSPSLSSHPALPSATNSGGLSERRTKASTVPPTGSPTLAPRSTYRHRPEDDILVQPLTQGSSEETQNITYRPLHLLPAGNETSRLSSKNIRDLPIEIQEQIINHIAGVLEVPKSSHGSRHWNNAMRHPRRKQLSDLSLVTKRWRPLIQNRLYRHRKSCKGYILCPITNAPLVKIKGTRTELKSCSDWLLKHPLFQSYVKHVEIWVPLFEVTTEPPPPPRAVLQVSLEPAVQIDRLNFPRLPRSQLNEFVPARRMFKNTDNASLEEILGSIQSLFPEAIALTIEGGHCKKSRKIQNFSIAEHGTFPPQGSPSWQLQPRNLNGTTNRTFPKHFNINTLILKGAWNIVRHSSDFQKLAHSLPNLKEWHCVYAKPKKDAYVAMHNVICRLPPTISKINICLEGLNGKEPSTHAKWAKLRAMNIHLCNAMGSILPELESLTFTGHVCASLFQAVDIASTLRNDPASPLRDRLKLKSIDLFVRNCCRDPKCHFATDDPPSIYNWSFIQAFEKLILAAVTALGNYPRLNFVRIRFLDLDSQRPLLNPYFRLENDICTGMWSSKILAALQKSRPSAHFETITDDGLLDWPDGTTYSRPKSMKASSYAALAHMGGIF